jgi:hypothetical protein
MKRVQNDKDNQFYLFEGLGKNSQCQALDDRKSETTSDAPGVLAG